MKKKISTTNRRIQRKQKRFKQQLLIISCLSILLAFGIYRRHQPADEQKNSPIGGAKINFTTKQLTTKKTPKITPELKDNPLTELPSTDKLVKRAYTNSTWQPTPTKQVEPHWVDLTEDSHDRQELRESILQVTQIPANELVEWWLTGGETDNVIATVSDQKVTDIFRVYLTWQPKEGWLVEKIEELTDLPDFH